MKEKPILILLALFILLGITLLFARKYWEKSAVEKQQSRLIFPVRSEEVQSIQLTTEHGTFVLEKKEGNWEIVSPVNAAAEQVEINSLVSALGLLQIERAIEDFSTEEKEELGLLQPPISISLKTADGVEYGMRLGRSAPTGNRLYAMRAGDERVFLVDHFVRDRLNYSLYDLRDKSIFSFDPASVDRLVYQTEERQVAAWKRGHEDWRLERPEGARADRRKITALLTDLRYAYAKDFTEESADNLEIYGLVEPATRITVQTAVGQPFETLLLGNRTEDGERVFAIREGRQNVVEIEQALLASIEDKIFDLRDRNLSDLSDLNLQSIEISRHGEVLLSATRTPDFFWMMTAPQEGQLDRYLISNYLREMTSARVTAFLDEPGELSLYDLDPAEYSIILQTRDSKEELQISLIPSDATEEAGVESLYALRPEENAVLLLENRFVHLLKQDFLSMLEPEEEHLSR